MTKAAYSAYNNKWVSDFKKFTPHADLIEDFKKPQLIRIVIK